MARAGPSSAVLAISAALAAVLLLWPRRSEAAFSYPENPLPSTDDFYINVDSMEWGNAPVINDLAGFLWAIRNSEHLRANVLSGNDYGTFFGGSRFYSFADHPVITGEKVGVKLSDAMCRAAGFSPGCVSTAAGAYQIIRPTWERVRAAGAWGPRLDDFGPASQDEAARRLLIETGALARLDAGDLPGALVRASTQWASLPGSKAEQPQRGVDQFTAFFNEGRYVG